MNLRPQLALNFFEQPIALNPHFSERPWGSRRLAGILGKALPAGNKPIGESWELSDHPAGRSKILAPGTAADGMSFGDLLRAYPRELIGQPAPPDRYPLLIKYIDAAGDLSVQVHPDDMWCRRNGHDDRGKSECWYVMDCPPDARVIYGYRAGTTEAMAREALAKGRLGDLLESLPVAPGDFLTVPPHTVHAMLSGLLVCEIQQSSDTTFRLYDWDRQPARQLHVEESMEVTEWDSTRLPSIQRLGGLRHETTFEALMERRVLANDFFSVHVVDLAGEYSAPTSALTGETGRIVNVVAGEGNMRGAAWAHPLTLGSTWYMPAAMAGTRINLNAGRKGLRLLVTESREI